MPTRPTSHLIWLFTILLTAATVSSSDKPKFGKITDQEWQQGAPEDYPEANTLVLFDNGSLEVKKWLTDHKVHVRIKVLTQAGVDEIGDLSFSWNKKYEKLKKFKAHTITPDGKKHDVKKDAIHDKETSTRKIRTFSFPALEPGCMVEYTYRKIGDRLGYLPPWYFQSDIYTLHSEYTVDLPTGFTYNVQYMNVPPQHRDPVATERRDLNSANPQFDKIKSYTWSLDNLPPITDEPYMSSEDDYRSSLLFRLMMYEDRNNYLDFQDDWSELGDIQQKWLDDYCNKQKDIKKLAEQITTGIAAPRAKSQALYDHVVSTYKTSTDLTTRYFQHEKIGKLLEEKTGTAPGKNILLAEMHKAVGLSAWPVLISLRDNGKFYADYPNLGQFNYMIIVAQFDDGFEILDTYSKYIPYGMLPPNCLITGGLLVDGLQSQVIRIPSPDATSGRSDKTMMRVADGEVVKCSTTCTFTGYYATRYARYHDQSEPDEFVDDYFLDKLDSELDLGEFACDLDSLDQFTTTFDFTAEDLAETLDDNLIVKPVRFAFRNNPFKSEQRFYPVDFNFPFVYTNIVEIVCDAGGRFTPPDDLSFAINGASFERQATATDSSLVLTSILEIKSASFRPTRYRALRNFFADVAISSEDEVLIKLGDGE